MAGICISDSMSGCENGNMGGLPGPPHAKAGNRQTALAITASLLYLPICAGLDIQLLRCSSGAMSTSQRTAKVSKQQHKLTLETRTNPNSTNDLIRCRRGTA